MGAGPATRCILVTVAGLTPQVITETLYAVTQQRREVIHEVHVWTTAPGERQVREELLDERHGRFHAFCREYDISPRPRFDDRTIHVFKRRDGTPLEDIRTEEDNEAVADQITEFIRTMTADPSVRLLCSLAGGRKTIGTYLALALQFYGRLGDELFHVLVNPAFESRPDFFYPPRRPIELDVGGRRISTALSNVQLARVPVVFLRDLVPILSTRSPLRYSELVRQVQAEMSLLSQPSPLTIDVVNRRVVIGECQVKMTVREMALYTLLAIRRKRCSGSACPGCERCFVPRGEVKERAFADRLRQLAAALGGRDPRYELKGWQDVEGRETSLSQTKSKLNRAIARATNEAAWCPIYQVRTVTRKDQDSLVGIPLSPDLIRVLGADSNVAGAGPRQE